MPIINLRNADSDCVLRDVGTNSLYVVASNEVSNNSFVTQHDQNNNIAVTAVTLKKALWSTDSLITVSRVLNSSSNVAILKLAYSGEMLFDPWGMCTNAVLDYTGANLAVNCASANSTLVLEVHKITIPAQDFDVSAINE